MEDEDQPMSTSEDEELSRKLMEPTAPAAQLSESIAPVPEVSPSGVKLATKLPPVIPIANVAFQPEVAKTPKVTWADMRAKVLVEISLPVWHPKHYLLKIKKDSFSFK